MKKGIFITGTDTHVGKTVTSAMLLSALRSIGRPAGYFKPVQTGLESDTDEVGRLSVPGNAAPRIDPVYAFPEPISPHRAALLHRSRIDIQRIRKAWRELPEAYWIVEGAGGLLVPLNESEKISDLAAALEIPILIVSSTRLGTINHTLLTLEAARFRGLDVRGVVLAGDPDPGLDETLTRHGKAEVLAKIARLPEVSPSLLAREARRLFPRALLEAIFDRGPHG